MLKTLLRFPFSLLSGITFVGWVSWLAWRLPSLECSGESCLGAAIEVVVEASLWGLVGISFASVGLVRKEKPYIAPVLALMLNIAPVGLLGSMLLGG